MLGWAAMTLCKFLALQECILAPDHDQGGIPRSLRRRASEYKGPCN